MKIEYVRPITTLTKIKMESSILASSNSDDEDDTDTCDCFAHRGNHSKCGKGCHNSGSNKDGFEISTGIW